ncbi:cyclase family protein [Pseudofrankia inefficax]|uniref:Cyclase family protein n=1 Tax=Pseudofrankia inefficax (strain DSM 45817 / CECT 9037 / DDB 130130 / EuI1c) TaxID=298654 RepID=E3IV93_PSEI1|nr:cyclase family protein [Pseudofrankia inefficax]ADP81257.1 cyclase family protein [Pseudofrankia inefficax]
MATVKDFDALADQVRNWSRWGTADQRGTLNLITPEVVRKAAATITDGTTFPLGMDLSPRGPQLPGEVTGRMNPIRTMLAVNVPLAPPPDTSAYSDDLVITPTQTATHWDALSHTSFRASLYNGIPAGVITAAGATELGIDRFGVVLSRGVLLDVARHVGGAHLPRKFAITREVLEATERAQGVAVEPGDVVLVRTGLGRFFLDGDIPGYRTEVPALDVDAALYFHERDVAAVAIDNMPTELLPSAVEGVALPLHTLCLVMMGLPLGENWVLEDLAQACAADGRYAFLLDATPEPFVNSTGGLVSPVAIR